MRSDSSARTSLDTTLHTGLCGVIEAISDVTGGTPAGLRLFLFKRARVSVVVRVRHPMGTDAEPMDLSHALDLDEPPIFYNKSEYIQTASGNKVSRQSVLCGSHNISLAGKSIVKPGVILRGDLQMLRIGKFVNIGEESVIRPPYKKWRGGNFAFFPLSIGDHVTIGARTFRDRTFPSFLGSFTCFWARHAHMTFKPLPAERLCVTRKKTTVARKLLFR